MVSMVLRSIAAADVGYEFGLKFDCCVDALEMHRPRQPLIFSFQGWFNLKKKRGFPDWQLYFDSFFGRSSFSNSLCTKDQLLLGRAGVCLSGTSRLWTLLLRIAREDTTASQHQGLRLLNQMVCLLGTLGGGFRGAGFRVVFLLECMLIWSVLSDCDEIMEDVVNVRTKLQCENAKLIARPFLAPWGRKKKQDSGSNKNWVHALADRCWWGAVFHVVFSAPLP